MRRRTIALPFRARQLSLYLVALAAAGGLALLVASADAEAPSAASVTAKDYSFDNGTVTIAQGGTVSFSYPTGVSLHDVHFATDPTSCTGMPSAPSGPGWSGSCTFDSPGSYSFFCDQHYYMTGKVNVVDPNAPPTGTTGPTTGTETGPPVEQPSQPVVKVAGRQRGVVVRGSVTTPGSPSEIAVTAFATKSTLSAGRVRRVRIGAVSKHSTGTGKTSFALRINRTARRALRRRHRLPVSLRIVITPDGDYAVRKTATVVLREPS